jgi:serine phosphatase RsbU (regulator of sigma subunit)
MEEGARLTAELAELKRALFVERRRTSLFAEGVIPIGVALSEERELPRILEMILVESQRLASADGATLYMKRAGVLEFFMVRNTTLKVDMGGASGQPITWPPLQLYDAASGEPNMRNVATFVAHTREKIHLSDIRSESRFDFSGAREFDKRTGYRTRSLFTLPLTGLGGEVVAVLQLINPLNEGDAETTDFAPESRQLIESLATLASAALVSYEVKGELYAREQAYLREIENQQARMERELTDAAMYIRAILPPPMTEPFHTDWRLEPCSELGGDVFGYHWIDKEHFGLYMLDVCGHGAASALLSVGAVQVLRTDGLPHVDFRDPGAVVSAMNNVFLMRNQNNLYFTLWFGVFHAPSRKMRFACAGHPPALLLTPSATKPSHVQNLGAKGLVLGARENKVYQTHEATIPAGSKLFLLSDGVYEIRQADGRMWDQENFLETLIEPLPAEVSRMDHLLAAARLRRGADQLDDDFSIVEFTF